MDVESWTILGPNIVCLLEIRPPHFRSHAVYLYITLVSEQKCSISVLHRIIQKEMA